MSVSVTPHFLKKYEEIILQIGKNVRLIGSILTENSHSAKEKVLKYIKTDSYSICDSYFI